MEKNIFNTFVISILKNRKYHNIRFCVGIQNEHLFDAIKHGTVNSIFVEIDNNSEIYNVRLCDINIGKAGDNDIIEIHNYPNIGGILDFESCIEFKIISIQNNETIPILSDNQLLINFISLPIVK